MAAYSPLGRSASHRIAMLRNMATSLILHGKIETTFQKAQAVAAFTEKLVTKSRTKTLQSRRIVGADIKNQEALKQLFDSWGPTFRDRPGGYTRITKIGYRKGDNATMAVIEFLAEQPRISAASSSTSTSPSTPSSTSSTTTATSDPAAER
jgi:large subunit ribosomal protein L17